MPDNIEKRDIPGIPEGSHPFLSLTPEQKAFFISTFNSLGYSLKKAGVTKEQIRAAINIFYDAPILGPQQKSRDVQREFRHLIEIAGVDPIDITKARVTIESSLGQAFHLHPPPDEEDQRPASGGSEATPTE